MTLKNESARIVTAPEMETIHSSSNGINMNLLTMDNPVFNCWLFWCSILVMKMLIMSLLTAIKRIMKKAFANAEDAALNKVTEITLNDPDVERVRRAHLNDLENILPYLIISLAYITTDPNKLAACILFRIVAVARILHTLVYAVRPLPQPSRAIVFNVGLLITLFMAIYIAVKSAKFI